MHWGFSSSKLSSTIQIYGAHVCAWIHCTISGLMQFNIALSHLVGALVYAITQSIQYCSVARMAFTYCIWFILILIQSWARQEPHQVKPFVFFLKKKAQQVWFPLGVVLSTLVHRRSKMVESYITGWPNSHFKCIDLVCTNDNIFTSIFHSKRFLETLKISIDRIFFTFLWCRQQLISYVIAKMVPSKIYFLYLQYNQ